MGSDFRGAGNNDTTMAKIEETIVREHGGWTTIFAGIAINIHVMHNAGGGEVTPKTTLAMQSICLHCITAGGAGAQTASKCNVPALKNSHPISAKCQKALSQYCWLHPLQSCGR